MKTYTVEQVAEILQLEYDTVRNYVKNGKIKGLKIGRVWRIREEDLRDFLSGQA